IHLYLYKSKLELINLYEKDPLAVKTIAPLSTITLSYCSHNSSNGIIQSQSALTISYGKSVKIISTLLSGISFIPSIQSSLKTLFTSYPIFHSPYIFLFHISLHFLHVIFGLFNTFFIFLIVSPQLLASCTKLFIHLSLSI